MFVSPQYVTQSTPEQKIKLIKEYQETKSQKCKEEIFSSIYPLVIDIIQKKFKGSHDMSDIFQEAMVGVSIALERFDVSRGWSFAFFKSWIYNKIFAFLESKSHIVKRSLHAQEKSRAIERINCEFWQKEGRAATVSELAYRTGNPVKKVCQYINTSNPSIEELNENSASYSLDFNSLDKEYILEALEELNEKYREVLKERMGFYGEPYSLDQISKRRHCSRQWASSLVQKSIKMLQKKLTADVSGKAHDFSRRSKSR